MQTDRHRDWYRHTKGIDRMKGTQRDGCIDKQTEGKPKDIWKGRQTDRQTGRSIEWMYW